MRKLLLLFLGVFCLLCPSEADIRYALPPIGFEEAVILAGWTQENVEGTVNWQVEGGPGVTLANPAGANAGSYRLAIRRVTGSATSFVTRLISPAMDLTEMQNPELCFAHAQVASFDYFDTLRVYYRTTSTAKWTLLREFASPVSVWTTESIPLEKYLQGTAYQIAFEVSDHAGKGVVLDDICVLQPSICQKPLFQMVQPTSTTAFLEFVAGGTGYGSTADLFDLIVSDSLLADPAAARADEVVYMQKGMSDNSVMLSNLEGYTTYYVYLRTNCADNATGYTDWTTTEFQTTMLKSLPYTEDFNLKRISSDFVTPEGWTFGTNIDGVSVPYVYVGSTSSYKQNYSVDSTAYLAFTGASSTGITPIPQGKYVYAATPELSGDLSKCAVSFWGTAYTYISNGVKDYAAELTVGVMTDPADYTTFTAIRTVKVESAYQFKHFVVSLNGYSGDGKYVALRSAADAQNVFFVDNFSVAEATVPVPEDIRVYNVVPSGFDVSALLNGTDSWNIRVSDKYVRDAASLSSGDCLITESGITGSTYHVTGNNIAGKTIKVYLQAVKNGVASAWSFPVTLRIPTMAVPPLELKMNIGYSSVSLYTLNNEIHYISSTKALDGVYFPLRAFEYVYPEVSTSSPTYDGGHLVLRGVDNYFVLPYVDRLDSLMLSFQLALGYSYSSNAGQSRVAVGVMTDPYDLSTFTEIGRFDGESSYVKCELDFSSYTGGGHYVAIRAIAPQTPSSSYGSDNALDDIVLKKIPTCRLPKDVTATPGADAVDITWDAFGMNKWLVSLYDDSQLATLLRDSVVSAPSVRLSGLLSGKQYYYTIRTICGMDTVEAETSYMFSTSVQIPFKENFTAATLPSGWGRYSGLLSDVWNGAALTTTSSSWSLGSNKGGVTTDGNAAYINVYGTSCKAWLVSPNLHLNAASDAVVRLTFDAALVAFSSSYADKRNTGTDDQFAVAISTDDGTTWSRANTTVWNNANDSTTDYVLNDLPLQMQKISVDLSQYIGGSVRIAFYAESTMGNADNYLLIDNVVVSEYDANCLGISALSALAISSTEANVMWTAGGEQSVHVDVYDAANARVFSDNVTTSPYTLTNLVGNTEYRVEAYQSCNPNGDTLSVSFRTQCDAYTIDGFGTVDFSDEGSLLCWTIGIGDTTGVGSRVLSAPYVRSLSGFGKVLYMEKPKGYSSSYYGNNYYAILPTLEIDDITEYQVVFDAATTTSKTDTTNVKQLYVGVITDPADLSTFEITDTLTLQYAADSVSLKSYAIGFDNYKGDYLGEYGKYIVFMVAAPNLYADIAIIDNVRIEAVAACHQVLDAELSNVKTTSAVLQWSSQAGSARVALSSVLCNPDTMSHFVYDEVVNGHSVLIDGLTPATTYYAYVKAICGVGDTARWSGHTIFTTAYGVPYLETFTDNSLTTDWKGYKVQFPVGKDTMDVSSLKPETTASTAWYMTSVPTGVSGMEAKVARVEVYGTGSYNALLVSPSISLPELADTDNPIAVSFKVAKTKYSSSSSATGVEDSSDDKFSVMVSLDGGATWTRSNGKMWASDGSGDYNYNDFSLKAKRCKMDLSAYAGKDVRIGFFTESSISTPDTYIYVDSVSVDYYTPQCEGITNIAVYTDSITDATALLTIKATNLSDTIEYVYGVDSIAWATAQPLHADSSLVLLSGLKHSTLYAVYARTLCASGDTSAWFGPIYFSTKCVLSVPALFDFDDKTNRYDVTSSYQMENCWEVLYSNSSYVPKIKDNSTSSYYPSVYSYSGTSALFLEMSSYGNYYSVAAMPLLDADLDTLQLSFMARAGYVSSSTMTSSSDSYLHSVKVGTMDNLRDTATFRLIKEIVLEPVESGSNPDSDPTAFWRQQVVSLQGATGKYVVFMQTKGSKYNYIAIDDVSISKRSGCPFVENVEIDSISSTSARVHWTSEADHFAVSVSNAYSESVYSVEDTILHLQNLLPDVSYRVRVASVCGTDTTLAVQKGFSTPCAIPFAENFADGLPNTWQRLSGNILNGATAQSTTSGWLFSSTNTYGINAPKMMWELTDEENDYYYYDYTYYEQNSVLVTPNIEIRSYSNDDVVLLGFDMALTSSYSSSKPSASYTKDRKFAILVSENDGATWMKTDSLIWGTDTTFARCLDCIPATSTHYSFDFSAYKGKNIRIAFYAYSPANDASAYLHLSNVTLKAQNLNCIVPTDLAAINIKLDSATFVWHSDASAFEIQVATNNKFVSPVCDSIVSDTTFTIGALAAGTRHFVRVRTVCGEDTYSDWAESTVKTAYGLPFIEEFTAISTAFPEEWGNYKGLTLSQVLTSTSPFVGATTATNWGYNSYNMYAFADKNHIGIEMYSSYSNSWLVSPAIDFSKAASDKYLLFSFDAALSYWNSSAVPTSTDNQKFYVAVSEDGGVTWNKENLIVWSNAAADSAKYTLSSIPNLGGRNYRFDFSKYAGKTIQIAFGVYASSNDNRLHIDNIRLEEITSLCFEVENVSLLNATAATATLNITPAASDSVWQYAYCESGAAFTGSLPIFATDTTVFTIDQLNGNTAYDVYVRSICAVGDTAAWSGPYTVKTAQVLPFAEEFSTIATVMPADWSQYKGLTLNNILTSERPFKEAKETSAWGYSASYNANALTDANHIGIELYSSNSNSWLVSPRIDLSQISEESLVRFSFDAALTYWYSSDVPKATDNQKFYVAVSEDGGVTWNKENVIVWSNAAADSARYTLSSIPAGNGRNFKLDFSKYAGKNIQLAFGIYASANDNRLHIDNVRLETVHSICVGIIGMQSQKVSSTSAEILLAPSASDSVWQYVYGVSGFVLADSVIRHNTDTSAFVLSGLQPATSYDVYVRSICAVGDTSEWSAPYSFLTNYTLPLYEDFDSIDIAMPSGWATYTSPSPYYLFSGTAFSGTSTYSGWMYNSSYNGNAFGGDKHISVSLTSGSSYYWLVSPVVDLTNLEDSVNVALSFDMALTAAYTAASPSDDVSQAFYVAVSADGGKTWNKEDAIIWSDDLAEAKFALSAVPNGNGQSCTINLSKYAGKSIQVAFGAYYAYSSYADADIRLHLDNIDLHTSSALCFDVDGVRTVAATTSSLSFEISDGNRRSTSWQYVYGLMGFNLADSIPHNTNRPTFRISDLQPATSYDIYVRSICGDTDTTAWSKALTTATAYMLPFEETFNTINVTMPVQWNRYKDVALTDLLSGAKSFATETPQTISGASTNYWGYNSNNANALTDANHIGVEIYTSYTNSWLLTPVIELSNVPADEKVVFSFDAALTYFNSSDAPKSTDNQRFYLLVSEDAGATWKKENLITWSNSQADSAQYRLSDIATGAGTPYMFDFTRYVGKAIQIAMGVNATANDNRLHIDNVSLYTATSICLPLNRITCTATTAHSISLHIDSEEPSLQWQYAYGNANFMFSDATPKVLTGGDFTIADLLPETTYDVYLRTICGVGDTSRWMGPFAFTTNYALPFVEEFDNISTTMQVPEQWLVYADTSLHASAFWEGTKSFAALTPKTITGSTTYWGYSTSYTKNAFSDKEHIGVEVHSAYRGTWLLTPVIEISDVPADEKILFSFDVALTDWYTAAAPTSSDDQQFYLMVSEDAGTTWTRKNTIVWSNNAADSAQYRMSDIPNGNGRTYMLDFTSHAGKNIQIALGIDARNNDNRLHIDNVNLYVANSFCPGIRAVERKAVSATSATLNILLNDSALQWQFAYGPTGFIFTDKTVITTIDTTEFTITGLSVHTAYDVYARSICAVGDTSAWSKPYTFATAYVVPFKETFEDMATVLFPAEWTRYKKAIAYDDLISGKASFQTTTPYVSTGQYENCWGYNSSRTPNAFQDENHISVELFSSYTGSWMVSPVIDMSDLVAGDAVSLTFDAALTEYYSANKPSTTDSQRFYVIVSEDAGATWTAENTTTWGDTDADYLLSSVPNGNGQSYEIDMSKYVGKQVQLAFGVEASSNDNILHMDNIAISQSVTHSYAASVCNSGDYVDAYFSISRADLVLGSTTYTTKLLGQNNAPDTVVTLTLSVYPAERVAIHDTICEGYMYQNNGFNFLAQKSTVVPLTLTSHNGCDSLVELHLEVIPTTYLDTTIMACQSYTYKGTTYYSDKVFTDTLSATTGCDSIVRTFLRISATGDTETMWRTSICQGDSYNDEVFSGLNKAGTYTQTVLNDYGCDSTITLHLLVADAKGTVYDTIRQTDLPYLYEGKVFLGENTKVGDYQHDVQSSCGQVTLFMHVYLETAIANTSVQTLHLTPNPAKVGEPVQIVSDIISDKDYTISVFSSVGQLVYHSRVPQIYLPGFTAAGIYTVRIVNAKAVYQTKLLVQ